MFHNRYYCVNGVSDSNNFMKSYLKTQELARKHKELSPRTPSKKPKREKLIRVTDETYDKLMQLGKMGDDFEDVISRLLKEHKE